MLSVTSSRPADSGSSDPLLLLAIATAVGSLGLGAGGAAGPLLAAHIQGSEAVAGLPLGVLIAGAGVTAVTISRRTSTIGRAAALSLGYGSGAIGAAVVIAGGLLNSLAIVLAGTFLLGGASAAVFLTRYAAAELAGARARGRGVGVVLFAATIGAVASPNLLAPGGRLAAVLGLPELTGLFIIAIPAFLIAALIIGTRVRVLAPDLGRTAADPHRSITKRAPRSTVDGLRESSARAALLVLATTNFVMVAVMAVAPVHMVTHGNHLSTVGFIVSIHVAGMFAPSLLTGRLADRVGPLPVALAGTLLLLASGVVGGLIGATDERAMTLFLLGIGLGWNAGVVGASALLISSVRVEVRPQAEGIGEVAMSTAAAAGVPGAGMVVVLAGFGALCLVGAGAAALAAVGLGIAGGRAGRSPAAVSARPNAEGSRF